MKKLGLSILGILMTMPVGYAFNLTDVDQNSRFYKSVSVFVTEGIIQGYEDNTFQPEREINRAEALKIILEAFQLENGPQAEIGFSDVGEDAWFDEYVSVGVERGIVQGYDDGSFRPGNQVNFVEALKMALEAKDIDVNSLEFVDVHSDITDGNWFSGFASFGYDRNLFEADANGDINLGRLLTRGEFTELVYRVRSMPTNGDFDITYNWKSHSGRTAVDVKIPVEWDSFDYGGNGVLIGNDLDPSESKIDFLYKDPNESRGLMYVSGINEDLSADDFLGEIKNIIGDGWALYEEAKLDGKFMLAKKLDEGMINYYYWVENGKVIIGEARFDGTSEKRKDYDKIYSEMFRMIEASDSPGVATIQERLNEVRKAILVEGQGMETVDLFIDKTIIETDVVGVGTGPIDYYYIPVINHTLKYEREADIILDIMEGETFDF